MALSRPASYAFYSAYYAGFRQAVYHYYFAADVLGCAGKQLLSIKEQMVLLIFSWALLGGANVYGAVSAEFDHPGGG